MRRADHAGFTLAEVLAVIVIIGLLAGLILGLAGHVQKTAPRKQAEAELAQIAGFIAEYQVRYGNVPQSRAELAEALGDAQHARAGLADPWGNAYEYAASSLATYFLWSTGGAPGVPASYIGNWP